MKLYVALRKCPYDFPLYVVATASELITWTEKQKSTVFARLYDGRSCGECKVKRIEMEDVSVVGRPKRKVVQIDYYTGEVIEVYDSVEAAAYDNWLQYASILKALNHRGGRLSKRKIAFKFKENK